MTRDVEIRRLSAADIDLVVPLLDMFGKAFGEEDVYGDSRPERRYLERLLSQESFVVLAALAGDCLVGGLVAYELQKIEQARSEFYIYDLAVAATHRRQGVATALIEALRRIAASRGAHVLFVQADHGDDPAIALYSKLGVREDVLHFDIQVKP